MNIMGDVGNDYYMGAARPAPVQARRDPGPQALEKDSTRVEIPVSGISTRVEFPCTARGKRISTSDLAGRLRGKKSIHVVSRPAAGKRISTRDFPAGCAEKE